MVAGCAIRLPVAERAFPALALSSVITWLSHDRQRSLTQYHIFSPILDRGPLIWLLIDRNLWQSFLEASYPSHCLSWWSDERYARLGREEAPTALETRAAALYLSYQHMSNKAGSAASHHKAEDRSWDLQTWIRLHESWRLQFLYGYVGCNLSAEPPITLRHRESAVAAEHVATLLDGSHVILLFQRWAGTLSQKWLSLEAFP